MPPLVPASIPKRGNGLIGNDPEKPEVVVASNGGSDLVYVPGKDTALAGKVIEALLAQDYVSGLFVDSDIGSFPGTLPLSCNQPEGHGAHAAACDRDQLPFLCDRLRRPGNVRRQRRRHRFAAGPRHARQLQPRGHHEFHGSDRSELQNRFCR